MRTVHGVTTCTDVEGDCRIVCRTTQYRSVSLISVASWSASASVVEVERQPDVAEPDRGRLVDAQGAAEVQIALGVHGARDVEPEGRGHGPQRDARARDQRLQQHVARAQLGAVAAGGRVQARLGEGGAVRTRHAMPVPSSSPSAIRVTTALAGSSLYRCLRGACFSLSTAAGSMG